MQARRLLVRGRESCGKWTVTEGGKKGEKGEKGGEAAVGKDVLHLSLVRGGRMELRKRWGKRYVDRGRR